MFYSRTAFGELSALREHSTNYADAPAYQANLGKSTRATDIKLRDLLVISSPVLSTYEFLRRTRFENTSDLEGMQELLHERLRSLASNTALAYQALWVRLDHLGMRADDGNQNAAIQHRLTKADIKALLVQAGAMLTPPMNIVEIRTSFQNTSAIGRTWRRDIGGERISSPLAVELMAAIDGKSRSILLTGHPGSGKTCVMLALQDALEERSQTKEDIQPFFIQSREFADIDSAQERQAQGLSSLWVEQVARMAEAVKVVVVIDSLDVLSIAREHKVLDYFLAQIDRLLRIPNVTVVTACRDFDRRYDRRIAERKWDNEFKCPSLDWDTQVAPLLAKLGIDASNTDATTRELISNPRELALFVELAQQNGSFNVVTSQALAQRYLATIVQSNSALGNAAMRAIEDIAAEMLKLRSLAVPPQRFSSSQDIQRALLSHRILQLTQDGKLTFGHQTLLDVLVISGAIRQGITLDAFIRNLPSVPFVRPSIRSFVAQLATEDRRKFRGQLRTVLMGNHAFHIRRLVAECLAGHNPQDEDWPLVRDLKTQYSDVFQVIYIEAVQVEWHYFWLKHLVPALTDARDSEGLARHAHRIAQWKNEDAKGVVNFWLNTLTLDWVNSEHMCGQLIFSISDFKESQVALLAPLLKILLKLPRPEHSILGHALARCVVAGGLDDAVLWRYIIGDVSDEDVRAFRFGNKLHCEPHEFGSSDDKFLSDRMQSSIALLELAITTIEQWRQIKESYWENFLHGTSHSDAHNQTDMRHIDGERVLWDAVESAVGVHAQTNSDWWQSNRERLCFSAEAALRYFAILACTSAPTANMDVIGRMLCNKEFLESDLSYELGLLMQPTFIHLDPPTQDAIQAAILEVDRQHADDPASRIWMLQAQAQLILSIPCHLRSLTAQAVITEVEKYAWPLLRKPRIGIRGGMITAPFSFEVFLAASDKGVLTLLKHYGGYARDFDDDLIGGESQVGGQLREAASRHPSRFMALLETHWGEIPDRFRNSIFDGSHTYLAYKYGNLQANNWTAMDEPNAVTLAQQILNELEKHPDHWHHSREAASSLENCSHVIQDIHTAERLVALASKFLTLSEESSVSGDSVNLLTKGINMAKGDVVDALMILSTQFQKDNTPWPEILLPTLCTFAGDPHPAVRAVLLRRLPYLQHLAPDLGWQLFALAMENDATGLWDLAERCLYYTYHKQFEKVKPWLDRLRREGVDKDLETWGRISALSALSNLVHFSEVLTTLNVLNAAAAWRGAASVWAHPSNVQQHREQCLAGLEAGISAERHCSIAVAHEVRHLFRETTPLITIPTQLLQRCFSLIELETKTARSDLFGIDSWLNAASLRSPMHALEATEIYLNFVRSTKSYLYNHENNLTQLLTRLFAQAEEQEESDDGAMLQRVVVVQDSLLALGVNGMDDWLKAIERP